MPEEGIKILRRQKCADFALLLARDGDEYEAHVYELTKTIARQKWDTVREQLECAVVHVLAVAGILGIELRGVVTYTVYNQNKLALDPALLKAPVDPNTSESARVWMKARLSWERGHIWMAVLGRDVEHRRIEASAAIACRPRPSPGDTRWIFTAPP